MRTLQAGMAGKKQEIGRKARISHTAEKEGAIFWLPQEGSGEKN